MSIDFVFDHPGYQEAAKKGYATATFEGCEVSLLKSLAHNTLRFRTEPPQQVVSELLKLGARRRGAK